MGLFQSKKGDMSELLLTNLFSLILLTILATLTALFVMNFSDSTFMERSFISKDISLTVDTLFAAPNNILIHYPNEIDGFQASLLKEEGQVKVSKIEGKDIKYPTYSFFVFSPAVKLNNFEYPMKEQMDKTVEPFRIIFINQNKDMKLYEEEGFLTNGPAIDIPDKTEYEVDTSIITKMDSWRTNAKTFIDVPSYREKKYYSDVKGIYECTAVEYTYKGILYVQLSKEDICKEIDTDSRISNMADSTLVIILRKSMEEKETNKAKIYYTNDPKSKKFAAILGNNLLKKGVSKDNMIIEEINLAFAEESKILSGKTGILFIAGNMNSDSTGIAEASSALNNAIKEYYEN